MISRRCARIKKLAGLRSPYFLVTLILVVSISSSWGQPSAEDVTDVSIEKLLTNFVANGSEQLFDGTFVYLFEDQVQTIKVQRERNENGQIIEKFVPLDGSQKDNIRILKNQHCLLDNGWHYQFHAMSSSFPFRVNNYYQNLKKYYDFSLFKKKEESGNEVVAGNQAVYLDIQAKDSFRYSYQLWFEPKSASLLKYKLINQTGKVVEHYLFTDINIVHQNSSLNEKYAKSATKPKTCQQQFTGVNKAFKKYFNEAELPDGYQAVSFRKELLKDGGLTARQFQLSDGLASVSVFIEELNKTNKKINGIVKLGPMSVAGQTIGQHQVTVLGAIPVDSALKILGSVHEP